MAYVARWRHWRTVSYSAPIWPVPLQARFPVTSGRPARRHFRCRSPIAEIPQQKVAPRSSCMHQPIGRSTAATSCWAPRHSRFHSVPAKGRRPPSPSPIRRVLADGTYYVLAKVQGAAAIGDGNGANDVAATPAAVVIRDAYVDVFPVVSKIPAKPIVISSGKTATPERLVHGSEHRQHDSQGHDYGQHLPLG